MKDADKPVVTMRARAHDRARQKSEESADADGAAREAQTKADLAYDDAERAQREADEHDFQAHAEELGQAVTDTAKAMRRYELVRQEVYRQAACLGTLVRAVLRGLRRA